MPFVLEVLEAMLAGARQSSAATGSPGGSPTWIRAAFNNRRHGWEIILQFISTFSFVPRGRPGSPIPNAD